MNAAKLHNPAKIYRRIFALLYDAMLTFAVMMFMAMLPTVLLSKSLKNFEKQSVHSCIHPNLIVMALPNKHSPDDLHVSLCLSSYLTLHISTSLNYKNPLFTIYLLLILFLFPAWFWVHGGQTLGMRAWKIKIESKQGGNLTWIKAFYRWLAALASILSFGAGYLWLLFDRDKQTFHDRISGTRMVQVDQHYVPNLKQKTDSIK